MAVTDETLLKLLEPAVVEAVITAVLAEQGRTDVYVRTYASGLYCTFDYGYSLTVQGGRVDVSGPSGRTCTQYADAIGAGLALAAGARYDALIAAALQTLTGKQPTVVQAQAEENGQVYQATVMRVRF